jgi:cell division protein FtsA
VVLTGGGALLPGTVELASYVFNTSAVRIGIPGNMGGQSDEYRSPDFATAVGLILCGNEERKLSPDGNGTREVKPKNSGFGRKLIDWLGEFF